MPHLLSNDILKIGIDLPNKNYDFSRFDWTGKIVSVVFKGVEFCGVEQIETEQPNRFGRGLYNEFGIDRPLGFEQAGTGDWFHKIGIGLLQKDEHDYDFMRPYQIRPARFKIEGDHEVLNLECHSEDHGGYAYSLKKQIRLHKNGFLIAYDLLNTGSKPIITNEYVHNFITIGNELIGEDYELNFPFTLNINRFQEIVNPEKKVSISRDGINFKGCPNQPFFFSNLSGGKQVMAQWELINHTKNMSIRETADFETNKINLWGCGHVVSPELFFGINLAPEHSVQWSRSYELRQL